MVTVKTHIFYSLFWSCLMGNSGIYIIRLKLIKQNLVKLADGYLSCMLRQLSFLTPGKLILGQISVCALNSFILEITIECQVYV